jgi:alkanesulfonate monooxygenase SsuD/methylene tetrahydromethanopterin reductase-like flavin-dependent oxidoreductase (luciferase family)
MRFALAIGPELWRQENGAQASISLAQTAECAGFDTIWASEDPDGWDAFGALNVLARETRTIRLGTGVTNPYLRHPNLIAASIATLDRASDGRAFLGLGRGEPDWYRAAFDIEIGSPLKRVAATVDLLRQWWGPEQMARGEGEIKVRNWRREFRPLGQPPIYLAATGPKMQALAGEIADGVRFNTLASLPFLERSIAAFRDGAMRTGRAPSELRIFANPGLAITESDAETEAVLERKKTTIALIHALPGMDRQLNGLETEFDIAGIMEAVRRHMRTDETLARGGSFADLRRLGDLAAARAEIPTALVDRVAIVGPLDRVRPRLATYAALGVTDVFVDPGQLGDPTVIDALRDL